MKLGPITKEIWPMIWDLQAKIFENYWQYSKIFPDMGQLEGPFPGRVTKNGRHGVKKGF